jgi:hypothetical protein
VAGTVPFFAQSSACGELDRTEQKRGLSPSPRRFCDGFLARLAKSIMPEGLADALTPQVFCDLLAFLLGEEHNP